MKINAENNHKNEIDQQVPCNVNEAPTMQRQKSSTHTMLEAPGSNGVNSPRRERRPSCATNTQDASRVSEEVVMTH